MSSTRPLISGSLASMAGAPRQGGAVCVSRWLLAIAVAALGLLSACASPTPPHAQGSQMLSGRLSLRVDSDPVRALSATFELSGDAQSGALVLSSSLGATLAQARWAPGETVLETPGARARYPDLDTLAEQALGERCSIGCAAGPGPTRPAKGCPAASQASRRWAGASGWRVIRRAGSRPSAMQPPR